MENAPTNRPTDERSTLARRSRVICVFAIFGITAAAWAVSYSLVSEQNALLRDLDHAAAQSHLAAQLAEAVLNCRRYEKDVLLNVGDSGNCEAYVRKWRASVALATTLYDRIEVIEHGKDGFDDHGIALNGLASYRLGIEDIVRRIKTGEITTPAEGNRAVTPLKNDIRAVITQSQALSEEKFTQAHLHRMTVNHKAGFHIATAGVVTGIAVLMFIGLVAWFQYTVISRISAVSEATRRMRDGDYGYRLPDESRNDELATLSRRFNRMATTIASNREEILESQRQAESSNLAKSEFLANISHELRTPLHGILSFSKFANDELFEGKFEELPDHLGTIESCASTLLSLVNDLLDLAKFESGRFEIQATCGPIAEVVTSVADEFRSLCGDKQVQVESSWEQPSEDICFDAEKIKQVARNLLANAVRFSPPGQTIELIGVSRSDCYEISVLDRGPGIPENELCTVFDKFVQSSRTKSGSGGTGLGLAICQCILNAHNGRIWAANREDGGAVFTFEIPYSTDHADATNRQESETGSEPALA